MISFLLLAGRKTFDHVPEKSVSFESTSMSYHWFPN